MSDKLISLREIQFQNSWYLHARHPWLSADWSPWSPSNEHLINILIKIDQQLDRYSVSARLTLKSTSQWTPTWHSIECQLIYSWVLTESQKYASIDTWLHVCENKSTLDWSLIKMSIKCLDQMKTDMLIEHWSSVGSIKGQSRISTVQRVFTVPKVLYLLKWGYLLHWGYLLY